jgi:hypothetical protein
MTTMSPAVASRLLRGGPACALRPQRNGPRPCGPGPRWVSGASQHPRGMSLAGSGFPGCGDQLPMSCSRRAASASSGSSVPSTGDEPRDDDEPSCSNDDGPPAVASSLLRVDHGLGPKAATPQHNDQQHEGPDHVVRAFVRVSGASQHPRGMSLAGSGCPPGGDQLPVSFSRSAASASSEASVPSAGEVSEDDDDEEEPFDSEDDEPLEE